VSGAALDSDRDTVATAETLSIRLPVEQTRTVLTDLAQTYRCGVDELLVSALAIAVARTRTEGSTALTFDLENHGRAHDDRFDLSQTVGWFTNTYPVRVDAAGDGEITDPAAAVRRVKGQLRTAPGDGTGFGLLRYLNPDTRAELAELDRPQVCFNYLGQFRPGSTSEWSPAWDAEIAVAGMPEQMGLPYVLEVTAQAVDAGNGPELTMNFTWAPAVIGHREVRELADAVGNALAWLVETADPDRPVGVSASDVSLLNLTEDELDELEDLVHH
jgi:non-ribosomal peptide synthase protein (TIGR01720 family)